MLLDPVLEEPARRVEFDRRHLAIWKAAMGREEFDLRSGAIDALATAHRQGVPDLAEFKPLLVSALNVDPHANVRLSAARALVEFDARDAAASLLSAGQRSDDNAIDLILTIDPALARWAYPPASQVWIQRVRGRKVAPAIATSALRCLAVIRDTGAIPDVLATVMDRESPTSLRLQAAQTLGAISATGLLASAEQLTSSADTWDALIAITMLAGHSDPDTAAFAERLTINADPRVRSHAYSLLARLDAAAILARHAAAIRDPDDTVRREIVLAFAAQPTDSAVQALAGALADHSRPVRTAAGAALIQFSRTPALAALVANQVRQTLQSDDWRTLEQAAEIAGELKLDGSSSRLVELLSFDRPEVRWATAVALRKLAIPETLPSMLTRAEALTSQATKAAATPALFESIGRETSQLFMAIGQQKYLPAHDLLVRYLPKRSGYHPIARGAALYALGKIHEGTPQPDLVEKFQARLGDNNPLDPEAAEVRRFSAIGLARMGSRPSIPILREFYEAENSTVSVGGACRWAIMQLEQSSLPPLRPVAVHPGPFFLEPIAPQSPSGSSPE
jgi:HEAT repeat protein